MARSGRIDRRVSPVAFFRESVTMGGFYNRSEVNVMGGVHLLMIERGSWPAIVVIVVLEMFGKGCDFHLLVMFHWLVGVLGLVISLSNPTSLFLNCSLKSDL